MIFKALLITWIPSGPYRWTSPKDRKQPIRLQRRAVDRADPSNLKYNTRIVRGAYGCQRERTREPVLSPAADIQKLTDDKIVCHYIACI